MLTREQILCISDIEIKQITVPEDIHGWGGQQFYIKQLTRGQQDTYLKRQWGSTRMKSDQAARNSEFTSLNIFGHDSWICAQGICDENGNRVFRDEDTKELEKKNGKAIGWIAEQIVLFSDMKEESDIAKGNVPAEKLEEELKN